ncbi:MAG: RIP metalloprotease RseP [Bacteroidota bacterium]
MSNDRSKGLINLGIVGGVILLAIFIAYLFGKEYVDLVFSVLKAIGLTLLGITLLVTIHELGHFLAAKAFGIRVEIFSIGFPPKLIGFKSGDTEYQLSLTPLGGYVKISGMIDESMDTEYLSEEPKDYEFRSKPVWQRFIVMVAGVVMNVLLGIFIFSMIYFANGEIKTPVSELTYGISVRDSVITENRCKEEIQATTLGHYLGFRTGDKFVSYNGNPFEYLEEYNDPNLLLETNSYFEVERKGKIEKIVVPQGILNEFSNDSIVPTLFSVNLPSTVAIVDTLENGQPTPAAKASMQTGDRILSIDSIPVNYYQDLLDIIPNRGDTQVPITFLRGNDTLRVVVQLDSTSRLGVRPDTVFLSGIKRDTLKYGFFNSFGPGVTKAFTVLSGNVKGLGQVATGQVNARKSVMGPIAIGKKYLEIFLSGGWTGFMNLTAMLSMILAFMNILPIPALDGGHIMFLLIEGITRRKPSTKVLMIAQQIGFIIIIGLMLTIFFNDFFTHIFYNCG